MKAKNHLLVVFALLLALLSPVSEAVLTTVDAQGAAGLPAEDHNCRFWGIISTDVPAAVIQDHLVNLPNSIEALSPANSDGWSVGYYPDGNPDPTVNRGFPAAYTDPNFDAAVTEAANATPRIAVSHVRNASSGTIPTSGNPHPFERVKDGRYWLMGHNGTIDKDVLLALIRPAYFTANPPQYGSSQSEWIDSDLYQIFMLQTLEDFNWQVKPALGYVVRRLREEIGPTTSPNTEQLNFFLTDGTTLWAYREGNGTHTLYYLYDTTGTPYSAVASQYPSASQGSWVEMSNGELITMQQDSAPVVEDIADYSGGVLLVDNYFDDSADSVALRANVAGQDWYESRETEAELLTLDETLVGGNGSKKAAFEASDTGNAYVTQEFGTPQAGVFAVQWDIYVDEILDIGDADRAGWMLIGDDTGTTPDRIGPNAEDSERFVYMGFFRDGGGDTGTMDLVARDRDDTWASFTTVASGLNLDQWYTIRVVCDIPGGDYDVYVDDVFQATVSSRIAKTSVTHISFAQWDDGAGAFYVDNVYQPPAAPTPATHTLTMAVDPAPGGTTTPAVGPHIYPENTIVNITASPNGAYEFVQWTGGVTDPNSASTTVLMDGDKTVTAHFSLPPAPLLVDNDFNASVDSADLQANDPEQDWYESRADVPGLLTLDETTVGGNISKKAKLDSYGIADNAYLTQDFGEAQSGVFVVSMDVYVDQIEDSGDYDRTGHIYIGYDNGGTNGPNSTSNERFVFMAFYDSTPGTSGDDIVLKARTSSAQAYGTTSQWTDVATGLSYDTWHTIKIQCDVAGGTYDVYVDDLLVGDDISCYAGYASSSVTHISFVADDTGRGTFYVDDVHGFNDLTMVGPVPAAGGITDPVAAVYTYPENMDVPITAAPYAGYQFDYWTGGVTAPGSASTTVPMDADRTVVAHFSLLPPVFLADNNFDASMDTADLRANGLGQDWYESRGEDPTLLTLNTGDIDGNSTNKAGFAASLLGNAYVSQEFGTPQGGIFSVRWDICVDNILDDAARDRAGLMLIGDDNDGTNGPNSTGGDRFVYMGFYCEDGCETGTMSLIANEPGDSYDDSATWRTVATGLALDQWHTIQVVCDLGTDTYNVYVNDTLVDSGVEAQTAKGTLTHISFAQWNDGAGAFYVDNVQQSTILVDHIVVAPASVTLGPDVEQQFTATGYYDDGDLNPIVGLGFSWAVVAGGGTIDQDGLFTAGTTGTYTNTVEATAEGIHGYASVTVEQGEAVEIQVLPEEATITAGETLEYSSRAKDDSTPPNIWDATAETVFSINDDALGSWGGADLNWYTSEVAGHWTVAGVYTGVYSEVLTATASLTVVHASAVSLEIAPADETVTAGGSVTYEATAEDAYGNTWPATGETVFSIVEGGAGGSWADNVYTSEVAGDWTVRGEYEGVPDTANLSVNAPPVAEDDEATTDEDTPVDINVLGNDSDADGSLDPTTVVIVTGPTDGSFSVDPVSGEVTYTPYADYYGSDTFTYTVEDDDGATSNEATVTVTVDPVNDAPVANDDAMSTPEDTAVIIDVLANDPDVDDAVLTISDYDTTSTEGGTVTCTGVCTYTPPGDFSGTDTFTYTVSDGDLTDIATVTITVGVTNDPPVAVNDAYGVSEGNTLSVAAAAGVLYNDSDADADSLTASLVSGPSHGTLTLDTDGSFTYVHDGSETTSDSFTYQANDGFADSNVATVAITVTPVNVAPVVSDIPGQTVAEGGTFVTISLDDYVSDVDNTDAEMTWTYSGDTDLTVTIVGRVATIGIPGGDWNGSETITFTATDPGGESDSDDATFTVTAAAPVAPEFLIYLPIISNNHVLSGSTSGW